jgi:hypothetical protein
MTDRRPAKSWFAKRPEPAPPPEREPPATGGPPTVTAELRDGPLRGTSTDAEVVEGRPPKIIDVPATDGSTCRYCLAQWEQAGGSAAYTFLYLV